MWAATDGVADDDDDFDYDDFIRREFPGQADHRGTGSWIWVGLTLLVCLAVAVAGILVF
jgi:hypothetical protein